MPSQVVLVSSFGPQPLLAGDSCSGLIVVLAKRIVAKQMERRDTSAWVDWLNVQRAFGESFRIGGIDGVQT